MPLKILHCGIFYEYRKGEFFYSMDRKISHGLSQNGHLVYDFSYRDIEKNLRTFGIKGSGNKKMNERLIEIAKNLEPDILLISKRAGYGFDGDIDGDYPLNLGDKLELIKFDMLRQIRKILPNIKIAIYYIDLLPENPEIYQFIDAFFSTNARHLINLSLQNKNTIFSYFPNISDEAFDIHFDIPKSSDIIYIGSDYKDNTRSEFLNRLNNFCSENSLNLQIYGSLNQPKIFGNDFFRAVCNSKLAISFNRDDFADKANTDKLLYASDRLAQFMGAGVCTFSPFIPAMDKLFVDGEDIVYFDGSDDCFKKIMFYLQDNKFNEIAKNGRLKALKICNAKRVTKFMLELLYSDISEQYEWSEFIYKNGEQIC